jgi:N-acetyl-anhydromuramyl-L-alanine amidase AmpD
VEKSGLEEERGAQPAPPAGWWTRWKYLSKPLRAQIDKAPVQKRRWRYIVVHNSGTRQGNAKAFEYYHLRVRKMPNGLAYHFVIGNGTSSGDGEIELGNRWRRQINGGHVHSDYLNNIALGICFVGDFNRDSPTKRQLEALEELIRYLRRRVGPIDRKQAIVKAHREINPPRWPTDCPGNRFPYRWLHGKFD